MRLKLVELVDFGGEAVGAIREAIGICDDNKSLVDIERHSARAQRGRR